MPFINEYKCNKCGFALPEGWGMNFYVEDDKGNRIACGHPGKRYDVEKVLGADISLEMIRERTGFNSHCICLKCLYEFELDLGESYWTAHEFSANRKEKDKRECPQCESECVKTEIEIVGENCPKCNEGIVERIWTGLIS